jgi:hypothetical protein
MTRHVPARMRHTKYFVAISLLALVGCGRPATESECNEIVTRVATLEYQAARKSDAPVDPASIETIRARVKGAMLKTCVGKRITAKAMRCVREAKTSEEIQKVCFD